MSPAYPPPVPTYSYTASPSSSSPYPPPPQPHSQRVSLSEGPLQLARAASQPRNAHPDFSALGSDPLPARRRPPAEPALPAPPAPLANPIPQPLSLMSSLSRGSYGSFSAPDCPHIVTRLMIPIYLFLSLMTVIVFSLANNRCPSQDDPPDQWPTHGWCCVSAPFSRYLSIVTYVIHACLLLWLLQLYHTPYLTFFPRHNRALIMGAFFLRAGFLVFVWMLYFLILSLNLIATLPEQVACAHTFADKSLFYPPAILNIACCLFVKIMLGLMGRSVWKYWELRHLSPEELLSYEQAQEEGRHYGLTREQVEVLTKVMLTCQDAVVDGEACPDCGFSASYAPPSLAHVLGEKIAPRITAVNAAVNQYMQRRRERGDRDRDGAASPDGGDLFAGVQIHGEQYQEEPVHSPSSPLSLPPSSSAVLPVPFPLEHQASSSSVDASAPKSKASLVPRGGLPSMTCGICLEDYRVHERVMILPCRHHGHIDCLMGWLNGHRSCPTCRSSVVRERERERREGSWRDFN